MSDLFVSQVMSLEAPQQEMDRIAKGQTTSMNAELTNNQVFMKALGESLHTVNQLMETEKEDFINEQEEESEEDNPDQEGR